MSKILVAIVVCALVFSVSQSSAESKMALSVGGDVLLPMGTFGDVASTGFGGSVRGQYDINPMFSAGLTVGYYTWSGKDVAGVTLPNFKGVPVRVFGKYYFMPADQKMRVYGIAELGFFFASVSATVGGVSVSASETDFNYAPGVGLEFPLGGGNTKLDISVRYDGIATTGETSGSLGGRVGVTFPIGN
jgi:outer membrane protein W